MEQTNSNAKAEAPETAQEAPEALTPESKIEALEAQLKEKDSKYMYLYADFENYKKRMVKERADLVKYGWENIASELLDVVDNLERAVSFTPPGTDKNLVAGLQMVLTQFKAAMEKNGVLPVSAVGHTFDPNHHEAVAQEPSPEPAGKIIQEHVKGYTLNGRLLRPSRVVVSSGT